MKMKMKMKRQGRRREKKMKKEEDNDDKKKMKGLFLGTSIKTSTRQTFYSVDNSILLIILNTMMNFQGQERRCLATTTITSPSLPVYKSFLCSSNHLARLCLPSKSSSPSYNGTSQLLAGLL